MDTFNRSTRSSLEIFRLYVELNQLSLKALSLSLELAFVNFILICTLDNGVMKSIKRREIISLVLTCLCIMNFEVYHNCKFLYCILSFKIISIGMSLNIFSINFYFYSISDYLAQRNLLNIIIATGTLKFES